MDPTRIPVVISVAQAIERNELVDVVGLASQTLQASQHLPSDPSDHQRRGDGGDDPSQGQSANGQREDVRRRGLRSAEQLGADENSRQS